MKHLAVGIVIVLAGAGLAFGTGDQEGAGSTVDMDMWLSVDVSPDQLWGGPGRDFIATVEESYPQIDLTFTTVGERDLVPQFIAAYGAGDPPDIVQQYSSGTTKMVNGGYFRAVDDLFDVLSWSLRIKNRALYVVMQLNKQELAIGRQPYPSLPTSRAALLAKPSRSDVSQYPSAIEKMIDTPLIIQGELGVQVTVRAHDATTP